MKKITTYNSFLLLKSLETAAAWVIEGPFLNWISVLLGSWTHRKDWQVKQDAIPVIPNLCPHFMARVGSLSASLRFIAIGLQTEPLFFFFNFIFN